MCIIRLLCVSAPLIQLMLTSLTTAAAFHDFPKIKTRVIQQFVGRHLVEVKRLSPIHIITHSRTDHTTSNIITKEYISLRPTFLVQQDSFTLPCITMICPKLRHIVAIYDSIPDVDPTNWRTLCGASSMSRAKIVLWIATSVDAELITSAFRTFWSLGYLNVILVSTNPDPVNHELIVHSYDPFWNNEEGHQGRVYILSGADLLYPNKMKNLQRYPIAVSMYDSFLSQSVTNISQLGSNSDVELLLSLSSWLNFTIDLRSRPMSTAEYYRMTSPNGTVIGITYDLTTNYSEILGNSHIWGEASDLVEYLLPHTSFISDAVVPMPAVLPEIIRIFKNFDVVIFTLLVLSCLVPIIYMYCKSINAPVLNTFRLLIHHQFYHVGSRLSERILAISWIVFTGLFLSIQQSHLVENMTNPPFEKRIDTLKELGDSDLIVMTDPEHFSLLNRSNDEVIQKIVGRTVSEYSSKFCYERLIAGDNVACFLNTVVISSARNKPEIFQSYLKMHTMREIVGHYWRTIFVKRGFPFLSTFNVGIRRLTRGGFVTKWEARDQETLQPRIIHSGDADPLNLSHFRGPFMIFLFGVVLSSCAFICEMIAHMFMS